MRLLSRSSRVSSTIVNAILVQHRSHLDKLCGSIPGYKHSTVTSPSRCTVVSSLSLTSQVVKRRRLIKRALGVGIRHTGFDGSPNILTRPTNLKPLVICAEATVESSDLALNIVGEDDFFHGPYVFKHSKH